MGLERQAVNLFFLFYYKCEIKFVLNIGSDFQLTFFALSCYKHSLFITVNLVSTFFIDIK